MAALESGDAGQKGSGVPVKAFVEDAQSLSPAGFAERYGSAFLLLTAAGLHPPEGPSSTRVELDEVGDDCSDPTVAVRLLVFPVRRSKRSVTHLVTLGRTSNNDVVIPDVSVSRFHAFLKRGENGRFQIQDGGSTNGTTVNGATVPAQGVDQPTELKSGDTLRLGQVEFTFLEADAMREFLLEFGR